MNLKEAVVSALKELIVPELENMGRDIVEVKASLRGVNDRINGVNKRLDDVNLHLADQSRRIDETNKRIDAVREELTGRIDETNNCLGRLYEVIVRREEHAALQARIAEMEKDIAWLKERVAA